MSWSPSVKRLYLSLFSSIFPIVVLFIHRESIGHHPFPIDCMEGEQEATKVMEPHGLDEVSRPSILLVLPPSRWWWLGYAKHWLILFCRLRFIQKHHCQRLEDRGLPIDSLTCTHMHAHICCSFLILQQTVTHSDHANATIPLTKVMLLNTYLHSMVCSM